jgi:hypothetical protein
MKDKDMILKDLLAEHPIPEMVKFSELNISEKVQENVGMIVKYRDLYHQELSHLDHLNDLYDKLVGLQYKYYRFDCDDAWTKVEIEKYCIPQDVKVLKMKNIIRIQEVKVRFFEMAWKAFEKMQWSMKLFVDTLKPY